jgi:predicted P-loop ATPase
MTTPQNEWPPKAQKARAKIEWERDTRGRTLGGNLTNLRTALAHVGVTLGYDAFARELRVNGAPIVDDIALEQIWTRITDICGWQPNRRNLQTVIVCDAQAQATHPVRAYLERLTWDGTERLDRWLVTYAGAADTEYVRAVSPLPLLAAVRRVRVPGTKFDELLILESSQGTGKSSALRALCGIDEWFSDDLPLGVDAKVVIERTAGKWIIEAAELIGNRGRESDNLKAFLSRQVDGPVRLAYGRFSVSVPRQFVMIGTTNHRTNYLKDGTGARRFWPVALDAFDVAALTRDRDQLWAEAVSREPDASIRLAAALWEDAKVEQEARRAVDPWEELIEARLSDGITQVTKIPAAELWRVLGIEANQQDNRHADRVAAIMERFGYQKRRNAAGNVWELQGCRTNDL